MTVSRMFGLLSLLCIVAFVLGACAPAIGPSIATFVAQTAPGGMLLT